MVNSLIKSSRWILIFSLFYGSMMSNPVEGRILAKALEGTGITEDLISFVLFLLCIAGTLAGGLLIRNASQARKVMLWGSAAYALGLASCFLPPTFLWIVTLPAMAMMIGAWLAGYGHYFKADCQKMDTMVVAAGLLIGSDLIFIFLNITTNLLPDYGRILAQITLITVTFFLLLRFKEDPVERSERVEGELRHKQKTGIEGRPLFLLWIFIFIISLMVGLLYQLVVPGFTEVSPVGAMFFTAPYILAVLLVLRLNRRITLDRWLYIALATLGFSFLFSMTMPRNGAGYIVESILFEGGVGVLYLYWWTIIARFLLRTKRPALVFAVGLTADSLGYGLMEILFGAGVLSESQNNAALAGITMILLAVVLLPLLYKGLGQAAGSRLELDRFGNPPEVPEGDDLIPNIPATVSLTAREKEILQLLLKGYTYEMVTKELQISRSTVKTHIANIYAKLEVKSKAQLIQVFRLESQE